VIGQIVESSQLIGSCEVRYSYAYTVYPQDTLRVWEVVLSLSANAYTDIQSAALYEVLYRITVYYILYYCVLYTV